MTTKLPTNQPILKTDSYYPYTSLDDKVTSYKNSIIQSLGFAVHPDHLKRAESKLKKLHEFWDKEIQEDKNDD